MAFPVYVPFFALKLHPHAHAFEVRLVKKTCIHIVHPDGRLIPFNADNLFYRDPLEQTRFAPLRAYSALASRTTSSPSFNYAAYLEIRLLVKVFK